MGEPDDRNHPMRTVASNFGELKDQVYLVAPLHPLPNLCYRHFLVGLDTTSEAVKLVINAQGKFLDLRNGWRKRVKLVNARVMGANNADSKKAASWLIRVLWHFHTSTAISHNIIHHTCDNT